MVNTQYPTMWRYVNKWSLIAYGLFFFVPVHYSVYIGHFSWKRGHVPRLTHNDQKIQKWIAGSGWRNKMIMGPALEWQQDFNNYQHAKGLRRFMRKHQDV